MNDPTVPPTLQGAEHVRLGSPDTTWEGSSPKAAQPPRIPGYEILSELGRGGMGVVYKARQTNLDRVVALKMILHAVHVEKETLSRFRTEAEIVARLQHPHIVQIHEVGESDGLAFIALEFCPGGGLDRKLQGVPLPTQETVALVETLARAVDAAHQAGIIHRDLKPANILLDKDGQPKVTDFGLAKKVEDTGLTASDVVLGTPSYMAPEQAQGRSRDVGLAADVYALGAILYECLTGRPTFRGATAMDTLMQVIHDDPVPPTRLNARTPRDLEVICLKCLRKEERSRYPSALDLAEELRRFRVGEPILARPSGRLERCLRWCRRNPKDAVLIVFGLLAVVVSMAAYLWIADTRQATEQARRIREARATTTAERHLAEAELLWNQAKTAPVGDLRPWDQARAAADRAWDVVGADTIEKQTASRVEQTREAIDAGRREAEARAASAADDHKIVAALNKLAVNQLPLSTVQGQGFVVWDDHSFHDGDFQLAFAAYGIDPTQPEQAAARIRSSAVRRQLIDGLTAWIPLRPSEPERRQVADLADRADAPNEFQRELRQSLVAKDRARLRKLARRNLSGFPSSVVFNMALACSNGGAFEEAVEMLRPAQQMYPADHAISFHLAYCLHELQPPRTAEALRFYTAAVALQPGNSMYRNSLGNALWQAGREDEAVVEYREANRLDPKNSHAVTNLGNALFRQGKLDEAVASYRTVARSPTVSNNEKAIAENNRGAALFEQGKPDEAAAAYRSATELNPRYAGAHYGLGWALLQRGDFQQAGDSFKRACALLPPGSPQLKSWENAVVRAERLRQVAGDLDAIVAGTKLPADSRQGVEFAQVCLYHRHPGAAVRLFKNAFSTTPALIESNRFEAAQAAARAGTGDGKEPASTEQQRAEWRTHALDWLRADFQSLSKKPDRRSASRQLRLRQQHAAFAGVREVAKRMRLPEDERSAWARFWNEVSAFVDGQAP